MINRNENVFIKEIKLVDEKYANFSSFLKSESFQNIKSNLGDLKIKSIHGVSFQDESILGFIVNINDAKGYKRDLMTVYKNAEPDKFITFLRENNINMLEKSKNGEVIWYDAKYSKINEMKIVSNKISYFKTYTNDESFSLKNARYAGILGCNWHCTREEFNNEYQRAKNECESDWQCDFACSFNPCAIAYAGVAAIRCTTCEW